MEYPPLKVLYAIAGDEKAGLMLVFGKKSAKRVALCCAGFPDDHSIFVPFASRLAEENDTLVGIICIPGYDDRPERPWTEHNKDGYSFDEMVSSFRDAAMKLLAETSEQNPTFTGIFHDWGVFPGLIFTNIAVEMEQHYAPDNLVIS